MIAGEGDLVKWCVEEACGDPERGGPYADQNGCIPKQLDCATRPAPKTCAGGAPDEMRPGLHNYIPFGRWRISDRNSLRVSSSLRKQPSIELVTAAECCFSTPRIIMHR
jgi:hypothetical protein